MTPGPDGSHPKRAGFTLVELLVVLGVLGLAATMLIPALCRTEPRSTGAVCQNNLRQLATGWQMYAEDNQGRLVYNKASGTVTGLSSGNEAWAGGFLDYTPNPDNTNTQYLVRHDNVTSPVVGNRYMYCGYLGSYVGRNASLFKCPADKSVVTIAGQRVPRVRSVSMNAWVGCNARGWNYNCQVYNTLNDLNRPAPANLFVFMDEHPDSINEGCFFTDPSSGQGGNYSIIDLPASSHNGAGTLAFADGHAELHSWLDPRTRPAVSYAGMRLNIVSSNNVDMAWLLPRSSVVLGP